MKWILPENKILNNQLISEGGKVEWTNVQWLKWQKDVLKEELNELALSKKVVKPKLVLLSNENLNKRTKFEGDGMNVTTITKIRQKN